MGNLLARNTRSDHNTDEMRTIVAPMLYQLFAHHQFIFA
jgi:hypothetical protein